MITEFADAFVARRGEYEDWLRSGHPEGYQQMWVKAMEFLPVGEREDAPDPLRLTVIDDGDYQGTMLFVIGASGYQPDRYWATMVDYGSCSGCDTFEGIRHYGDGAPNDSQVADYWTLALHMVQRTRLLYHGSDD